jgi:hypothetical protein
MSLSRVWNVKPSVLVPTTTLERVNLSSFAFSSYFRWKCCVHFSSYHCCAENKNTDIRYHYLNTRLCSRRVVQHYKFSVFFFSGAATQRGSWPPNSWGFLGHTRRNTVSRTPLDEWSARRRNLYLTTHNTHNRQTSMPPVRFEPTISAGERPQTYALDRAAIGTGTSFQLVDIKYKS